MSKKSLLMMLLLALLVPWAANAQTRDVATVDFETGNISALSAVGTVTNDATYPWTIVDTKNHTDGGTYCMKSTNNGVNSSTSNIEVTVEFNEAGSISFYCWTSCESASSYWDYGIFYIDGTQKDRFLHVTDWVAKTYEVTAGSHTFKWTYTKDSSVGNNDDCFYVDDITFSGFYIPSTPKPTGLAVSNVTDNSATLNWNENGTATSWQICLNDDETNLITTSTKPYELTGLTPLTSYTVKVRAIAGSDHSDWTNNVSFSTKAVAVAVGDAWSDDFEGETCGWELINGTITNAWAWGTAASNGGTHGLYISNDGGTTNAYSVGNAAMVYATKLLNFTEGKFEFSYNWMANGEGSGSYVYDYLRVALVPTSVTLTAGTSVPSGFSASSLPTGWIAVDGGSYLNGVTAWQSKSVAVNVTSGNYYLVMAWRDDTSSGSQPPAAVDNVSITKVACDFDVTNLAVSNITTSSATLSWEGGEATQWQVAYSTASNFAGATEEIVSTASYNMAGLQSSTVYYAKVRAYCGGEDFGSWCNPISFPTACEALTEFPYTENFDSYTGTTSGSANNLPLCWNYINGTDYSYYAGYPVIYNSSSNSHSGNNHLYFYSYYSSSYTYTPLYAILPAMENLEGKELTLFAKAYNASSSFKVGMMTDPNDINTFVAIGSKAPSTSAYEECSFILGQGNYVAIMMEAANSSSTYRGIRIDDITIDFAPTCIKPTGLAAINVTNHSATLKWNAGSEDQDAWEIAYKKGATFNPNDPELDWTTVNVISVTDTAYIFNKTLDAASTYYAYVRANCSESDNSKWSTVCSFTTKAAALKPTNFQKKDVGPDYAKLTWKAGGGDFETAWELYYVASSTTPTAPTAATEPTTTVTTLPTDENPYVLEGLANETRYYIWVRADHGTDGKSDWTALSDSYFTTLVACPTPTNLTSTNVTPSTATLNWTGYSDSYNVRYREPASEGALFSEGFEDATTFANWTTLDNGTGGNGSLLERTTSNPHSGDYCFQFSSYNGSYTDDFDQYLISPELTVTGELKFYYRKYNSGTESFRVGYSTTTNDVLTEGVFTWTDEITDATTTWKPYTLQLPDNVKYIAINCTSVYQYYFYVDDITIGAYEIPAGEWNYANNPIEALTTDIEDLDDDTDYEWQVQATCAIDPNDWSASGNFHTLSVCSVPVADSAINITYNSADLYWTGYQEAYNVRYRTAEVYDILMNVGNYFTGSSNWTTQNQGSESGFYYLADDYSLYGYWLEPDEEITGSQYLISPALDPVTSGTSILQFIAYVYNSTETIKVGFSSTDNSLSSFEFGEEISITVSNYRNIDVPAGTKYFAIEYVSGENYLALTNFIVVSNYVAAGAWQYADNVTSPTTINELEDDDTWYEWQVQGLGECTEGTEWSESDYFLTLKKTTQTVQLIAGANWFSTYLDITLENLQNALVAASPGKNITIKSFNSNAVFSRNRWTVPATFTWDVAQMYQLIMAEDCEITLEGTPIDPAEHSVTIAGGGASTWIGFPFAESMTLTNAFAGFATNGDVVRSKNGNSAYTRGRWQNEFELQPGQGYIYKSADTAAERTLIFPTTSKDAKGIVKHFTTPAPVFEKKLQNPKIEKSQLTPMKIKKAK